MEIELTAIFDSTPNAVYNAFLDSDEHSEMTGGQALITEDEGDKYSAWDGYIWGTILELKPDNYIRLSWRTPDFEEDQPHSLVEIFLSDNPEGKCELRLKHSELLDKDTQYEQGWIDNYFTPISEYFKK